MSRPDLFTAAAAQRHADAVNQGDADITDVRNDVRDWFASVYGWPLTGAQAEECRDFWCGVLSRIPEAVRS